MPFGTFTGAQEIQAFWKNLVDDSFSDVDYIDPNVEVIDEAIAILSSDWKMNKAKGCYYNGIMGIRRRWQR